MNLFYNQIYSLILILHISAPWTIVRMQYRMALLCWEIGSAVPCDNCLTDAPEIGKKTLNLPSSIFEVFFIIS
jgi:hypothetical protein